MAERQQQSLSQELYEHLANIGMVSYNVSGRAPSGSYWLYTEDMVKDVIKTQTKKWLPDVKFVELDVNNKTGAVSAYVWIPKNSPSVCNNELNAANSAYIRPMLKFSKQMKEFMEKFCFKEDRRVVSEEKGMDIYGIKVNIAAFMKIEFDENGVEYGKIFGEKYKKQSRITLTCNFAKGENGRFGRLNYIKIEKDVKSRFSNRIPKPRKSYNARR